MTLRSNAPKRAALEPLPPAYTILFVCTANICRSAYAEVAAHHARIPGVTWVSAGTQGFIGEPMERLMADEWVRRGGDPTHTSQKLTTRLIDSADLILTMGRDHRRFVLDEWPGAFKRTFLLRDAVERIEGFPRRAQSRDIAEILMAREAQDTAEVADPFGRGPEAAAACARDLDHLIGSLTRTLSTIV